jgi:hypothetical protein
MKGGRRAATAPGRTTKKTSSFFHLLCYTVLVQLVYKHISIFRPAAAADVVLVIVSADPAFADM